jgi:hypothetical protein
MRLAQLPLVHPPMRSPRSSGCLVTSKASIAALIVGAVLSRSRVVYCILTHIACRSMGSQSIQLGIAAARHCPYSTSLLIFTSSSDMRSAQTDPGFCCTVLAKQSKET